jgi:hypothetical protein
MPSGIPALIMISEFGNAGIAILGRDTLYLPYVSASMCSVYVRSMFG